MAPAAGVGGLEGACRMQATGSRIPYSPRVFKGGCPGYTSRTAPFFLPRDAGKVAMDQAFGFWMRELASSKNVTGAVQCYNKKLDNK